MDYILLALLIVTLILSIIALIYTKKTYDERPVQNNEPEEELEQMNGRIEDLQQKISTEHALAAQFRQTSAEADRQSTDLVMKRMDDRFRYIAEQNKTASETSSSLAAKAYEQQSLLIKGSSELTVKQISEIASTTDRKLSEHAKLIQERFDAQGRLIQENFTQIRRENNEQLDKIRESVSEKLEKTLNDQFDKSFKGLMEQMTQLTASMGELKGISTQVGTLEKALNGVKTRGIVGERQLKLLIQDVLNPNQYDVEVPTFPDSRDHVEIAIKLPDRTSNDFYYLPVDSKCHVDKYEALVDAINSNDVDAINLARRELATAIKQDAKDISSKYIREPYTTPYAILFVPFEGMYSEIVNLNLLDELNKMNVTVVGPYTMMAVLSTIVNYWQALAIEKKSKEIEKTLVATKDAFVKFDDQLSTVRKQLNTASKSLDALQTRRTNAVLRALRGVADMAEGEVNPLIPDSIGGQSSFDDGDDATGIF